MLTSLTNDSFRNVPRLQVLDLGYNSLVTLSADVFHGLNNLTSLILKKTSLLELSDVNLSHLSHLISLDLSDNALSSVPTQALQYSSTLETLDLSSNSLQTVSNHSLSTLTNLQNLYLRGNSLSSLEPAAFDGLQKPVTLDLSFNQLQLSYKSYPPAVFSPLAALESLFINGNDDRSVGDCPLHVFDPLRSLKTLSIDTFSEHRFGAAFTSLTNLRSLTLAGTGCNIQRIRNNTFAAFRHSGLETLFIQDCPLALRGHVCLLQPSPAD